ncbi:unnamed protein product, partial [Phaeothamnion confervicola]
MHVQKVGSYAFTGVLGEGTFATVKSAVHLHTGERVAIKCVPKRKIAKMNMGHQIRNEISIMKILDHPNVIKLKEVLMSSTTLYLVMELVRGGELYDLIAKGRMKPELAQKHFKDLMRGVAYCHSMNACHRDLKPENLLIDEQGVLKIADFGFAALVEFDDTQRPRDTSGSSNDSETTVCGTCAYIAPEVLTHEGYDGRLADVWSCGIIGFVLCCGFLPFEDRDDDPQKIFQKITSTQVVYPPWLSPEQVDVLSHLLERDPTKRWTAARANQHPWL